MTDPNREPFPNYRRLLTDLVTILARTGRVNGQSEAGHASALLTSISDAEALIHILALAGCPDVEVTAHGMELVAGHSTIVIGGPAVKVDAGLVWYNGEILHGVDTVTVRWGEPPSRTPLTLKAVRDHVRVLDASATVSRIDGGFEIRSGRFWTDGWGFLRKGPRGQNEALAVLQIGDAFADVLHKDIEDGRNGRHIYHAIMA